MTSNEENIAFSTNGPETTGYHRQKYKLGATLVTIYKNQLKMDHKAEHKPKATKHLEENLGKDLVALR